MAAIAIIGAGFSGTILALNLMKRGSSRDEVILIERCSKIGLGQAYSTIDSDHLLNIRASGMSPFSTQPDAFIEFLDRHRDLLPANNNMSLKDCYAPRRLYGRFLGELVKEHLTSDFGRPECTVIRGSAVDIIRDDCNTIVLEDGKSLRADRVVLALGNLPPGVPQGVQGFDPTAPHYVGDPWNSDWLDRVTPDANVLLVGTGLTMLDCAVSLFGRNHKGRIVAVSRHGLLPRRHDPVIAWPPFVDGSNAGSVRRLLRIVRSEIARASAQDASWQAVLNTLRPIAQPLWRGFSESEQARFIRHVRPWWDVHRHRVAPAVAGKIDAMIDSRQLQIHAGRIERLRSVEGGVNVDFKPRGSNQITTRHVQTIVNCSGPNYDFSSTDDVLLRRLLEKGRISLDRHRLGLRVAESFATLDPQGTESQDLFAIGPMLRGQYWEINAVPEIVSQAEAIAQRLWRLPSDNVIRFKAAARPKLCS